MKTFKKNLAEYLFLFWLGGSVYIEVELLYRGYTHWSMFVLAGFVFITVGWSNEHIFDWQDKFFKQVGLATLWATLCEYICGLILRCFGLQVWDYSDVPLNIDGLICVPFMFAWAALMIVAIIVDDLAKFYFFGGQRPHYHVGKWCMRLCPVEFRGEYKMNRIPCGGFNIGDGLTIDPVTRTLSALGGSSGANTIHFTWNDNYTEILSADKTVSEIIGNTTTGESYELDIIGFCQVLYTAPADEQEDAAVVFYRVEPNPSFTMSDDVNGCDLLVYIIKGTAKNSGDVWKYYTNNFFINVQKGIVLRSPGDKVFELKVDDAGTISATELTT